MLKKFFENDWSLTDVAEHWNATLDYDEINARTDSYFRRFTDSAPLFEIRDEAEVLDIDCRTGNGSSFFSNLYPSCKFTAVAVSPIFRELAEKNFIKNNVKGTTDVFKSIPLKFADNEFDVVLCYETLEHMPRPESFFSEIVRLTKIKGIIVLTTPNIFWEPIHLLAPLLGLHHSEGPHRMLSRRKIRSLAKKNNLVIVTEKTFVLIPAGPNWLIQIGKRIENILPDWLLEFLALRQTFVFRKE